MRRILIIALGGLLLLAACGQPQDLPSLASTSITATTVALNTVAAPPQEVPCPVTGPYPMPSPGEPTPTVPPTPTIKPSADPNTVPPAPAPSGLGTTSFPTDAAAMRGVFAALPTTVAGYTLAEARYNNETHFEAMYTRPGPESSRTEPGFFLLVTPFPKDVPNFLDWISAIHPEDWRRDNQLFWIKAERLEYFSRPDQSIHCYPSVSLTWTAPERTWVFHVRTDSEAHLETLIAAFVETVKSSPAPVPYVTPTPHPLPPMSGYPRPLPPMSGYPRPGAAYPQPGPAEPAPIPLVTPTMTTTPTPSS